MSKFEIKCNNTSVRARQSQKRSIYSQSIDVMVGINEKILESFRLCDFPDVVFVYSLKEGQFYELIGV